MTTFPPEISCTELQSLQESASELLLVDCREADEHALVALPGATLVPMSQLVERVGEIEDHKQSHLVVYCHLGVRSRRVAQFLREQGFAKVQSLAGGIDGWAEAIDPQMVRY